MHLINKIKIVSKIISLPPFAQPVNESELSIGQEYFSVTYVDDEMEIPTIETLVYIGNNLEEDELNTIYFQDIDSFKRGIRYDTVQKTDHAVFYSSGSHEVDHIFKFDQALSEILRCFIRRNNNKKQQ